MTYNVFGGMLNLTQPNPSHDLVSVQLHRECCWQHITNLTGL